MIWDIKIIQGRLYYFNLKTKKVILCGDPWFRTIVKLDDGECGSWGDQKQVLYFLMKKLEQLLTIGNFSIERFTYDFNYWSDK